MSVKPNTGERADVVCIARVRVTVEVTRGQWGSDCRLDQVFLQAGREAVESVERVLVAGHMRVVGEPVVEAVSSRKVDS